MPTPKNGFQILNLHPKKDIFKEKNTFFMYFCQSNTKIRWSKKFGGVKNSVE